MILLPAAFFAPLILLAIPLAYLGARLIRRR